MNKYLYSIIVIVSMLSFSPSILVSQAATTQDKVDIYLSGQHKVVKSIQLPTGSNVVVEVRKLFNPLAKVEVIYSGGAFDNNLKVYVHRVETSQDPNIHRDSLFVNNKPFGTIQSSKNICDEVRKILRTCAYTKFVPGNPYGAHYVSVEQYTAGDRFLQNDLVRLVTIEGGKEKVVGSAYLAWNSDIFKEVENRFSRNYKDFKYLGGKLQLATPRRSDIIPYGVSWHTYVHTVSAVKK